MTGTGGPEESPQGGPLDRFFHSPRAQKRFYWFSGGVFALGLTLFVIFFVRNNGAHNAPFNSRPVQLSHLKKTVKADPVAFRVARQFLQTAVLRKNLDVGWTLVAPDLKAGLSKKQWITGNNPVVPYPAKNADNAGLTIIHSWPGSLYVSLELLPQKNSGVTKPAGFNLEVVKIHGQWKVDYFEDSFNFPVHNGFGG